MKGRHYPNMPPLLDGEDNDHYSNRLIGVYGEDERPYDHIRNRQCALGWHNECSERSKADASSRRCRCPCHQRLDPASRTMTTELPLGEEELAGIETLVEGAMLSSSSWGRHYSLTVPRLIAALRAKDEELQRLHAMMRAQVHRPAEALADKLRTAVVRAEDDGSPTLT